MTWAILLVFLMIIGVLSLAGREQVSWGRHLRRIKTGVKGHAEWMAPEQVRLMVGEDFLKAIQWLQESSQADWAELWRVAPVYLSGLYLKRYQEILKSYTLGLQPRFVGVLRCEHHIEVRHFSEDGERCLVIDRQSECRMATYFCASSFRVSTQDLGTSINVYEMLYDKHARRWKIDKFIQQLPTTHGSDKLPPKIVLTSAIPPNIGRDN